MNETREVAQKENGKIQRKYSKNINCFALKIISLEYQVFFCLIGLKLCKHKSTEKKEKFIGILFHPEQ
jgi:hypothetical protein